MADQREARIMVEYLPSGKARISFIDPVRGRIVHSMQSGPSKEQIDSEIVRLRNQLQRAGNHVSVVERTVEK